MENERSTWPFPALLPYHLKTYPIPPSMPVVGPRDRAQWPFEMRRDLARWRDATSHLPSAGNQIYVHVPFCPFFCDYCPLYKTTDPKHRGADARESYVATLLREIDLYAASAKVRATTFDAVYFGGGTPTELTPPQLRTIIDALRSKLRVRAEAEITLEGVARQFLAPGFLEACIEAGVNRISYGVQTLDVELRRSIGRTDKIDDYPRLAEHAKGISPSICVNVDIMAGLPGQTMESFTQDLRELSRWPLSSIDVITYIMFPGTGLYDRILSEKRPAPEYGERLLELRRTTNETLGEGGFRPLTGDAYVRDARELFLPTSLGGGGNGLNAVLGLGPSSWGQLEGSAYRNVPDLEQYMSAIESDRFPIDRAMRLDAARASLRAQILGVGLLRLPVELVETAKAKKRFDRWKSLGLVDRRGDEYVVTDIGRLWYNQMQLDMLPAGDHLKLVRMLGSARDQETIISGERGLGALGDEISRYVHGDDPIGGRARWLAYRGYLKIVQTPLFDPRGVGWNGPVE